MQTLECQVCDHKTCAERMAFEHEADPGIEEWMLQIVPDIGVSIMCCPTCATKYNPDALFEGYKKRIREGRDFRFH